MLLGRVFFVRPIAHELRLRQRADAGCGVEPLSEIIRLLNERFGTNFTDKDKVSLKGLEERLAGNPALSASLEANTKENARLTFDHVVKDQLQEMVDTNFELYKRVTDDGQFARFLLDWLFERMLKGVE
jgi:type I restriction enzyme R subunit